MIRRSHAAAVAAALALPTAAAAQAQPDTFRLGEIVVSVTRLPMSVGEVPAAVTVITGDELRAAGTRLLVDALRHVPGIAVAQGGSTGAMTSLFLRGGESDYVRVLIDGVPANEPGGAFDFAHLPVENIERVEIVRGPASVLYGSDAVAGVIQIFTAAGSAAPRVAASIETGRAARIGVDLDGEAATGRGTATAMDASATGSSGRFLWGFGAARYDTDGAYALNNDYANRSGSLRLGVGAPAAARPDAALTLRWREYRYHFPTDGAGRIVDANQYSAGETVTAALEAGHRLAPGVEARALLSLFRGSTIFDDEPDSPADTLGSFAARSDAQTRRGNADVRLDVHGPAGSVTTVGAAFERQRGRTHYLSQSQWGPWESSTDDERESRALYAQHVATHGSAVTTTAGIRVDDGVFGTFTTCRAGVNVRAARTLTLRAAAGTAFKEPTFYENFAEGFVTGNPELRPERSRSVEAGFEIGAARASFGATGFRQRFRDLIQYVGGAPAGEPSYHNLAAADAEGVEFTARLRPLTGSPLAVHAGYTRLRTRVRDAGEEGDIAFMAGSPLVRRPDHSATLTAALPLRTLHLHAALRYVGARDDLDFSSWPPERVRLPAFTTVAAGAELPLLRAASGRSVHLTLRAENLLDERYQEVAGFPSPARAFFIGLRTDSGR
jgi:vitamin B12 transporter